MIIRKDLPLGYRLIHERKLNELILKSNGIILNAPPQSVQQLSEGKAWPKGPSKVFHDLILSLMNQQVSLTQDYLKEAEANAIMKTDFLQGITPQLDQVVYSSAPDVASYVKDFYNLGKDNGFSSMKVDTFTGQADTNALYSLTQYDFGLVTNLSDDLRNEIQYTVWNGVADSNGIPTIAKALEQTTLEPLTVGNRVIDIPTRAMMIAKTEAVRANNQGLLMSFKQYGVQMVDVVNGPNPCDDCQDIADNGPYPIDDIPDGGPPFHPNCFQKDTEVYTDNGWKLFKDVDDNDLILSMNPETHETEFISFNKKIEYHHKGEMYHIYNKWFDMQITPEHDVYTEKRVDHGKQGRWLEPRFVKPSELHSEHRIPRTCSNNKESPEFIDINGLKFKPEDYAFFMAWWLSEGHIITTRDSVIGISQFGDEIKVIQERIQKMFPDVNVYITGNRTVEFRHKELYDYLLQFGKSNEKYIPKEVFELSREHLNLFLDIYVKGDGHERKCNNNMVQNSSERTVFTSSKQLADDLSYLILLAGYYPSFKIDEVKDKEVEFKNGTYTINNDLTRLSINKTKHTMIANCTIDIIPYDDMVYCLELPKWHTLWVKSNNKTSWGGNCECTLIAASDPSDNPEDPSSYPDNIDGTMQSVNDDTTLSAIGGD